ncbi:hypothetical protein [Actinoplanes sp. L3-i22]|uniref:hypothetical protein n=1 Tax=Actinoplanes sp. L3-i22 TaxID=2836373 RepID=UPI001C85F9CD|nr:hypothetical protein [Actinoplanes sp. L3-i22]
MLVVGCSAHVRADHLGEDARIVQVVPSGAMPGLEVVEDRGHDVGEDVAFAECVPDHSQDGRPFPASNWSSDIAR